MNKTEQNNQEENKTPEKRNTPEAYMEFIDKVTVQCGLEPNMDNLKRIAAHLDNGKTRAMTNISGTNIILN